MLPTWLWRSGNLFLLPGGDLHFCVASSDGGWTVRTIEWNGNELLRGVRSADSTELEHRSAVVSLRGKEVTVGAGVLAVALLALAVGRRRRSAVGRT